MFYRCYTPNFGEEGDEPGNQRCLSGIGMADNIDDAHIPKSYVFRRHNKFVPIESIHIYHLGGRLIFLKIIPALQIPAPIPKISIGVLVEFCRFQEIPSLWIIVALFLDIAPLSRLIICRQKSLMYFFPGDLDVTMDELLSRCVSSHAADILTEKLKSNGWRK